MFLDEPSPGELQRSGSEYSLGLNDSGRSSLLTEDSDNEGCVLSLLLSSNPSDIRVHCRCTTNTVEYALG